MTILAFSFLLVTGIALQMAFGRSGDLQGAVKIYAR